MSTTVTYKGNTLTTVNNETKSLLTAGTWLEDDIEITDVSSGGSGTALIVDTTDSHGGIIREITTDTEVRLQGRKTVTPTSQTQIITADTGYDGIVEVEVAPSSGGVANVYQDENGVLILDSESTEVGEWKRPLNWMPYADGWDDDDFDGCYFVYDLNEVSNDCPQFYALDLQRDSGNIIVESGYVDSSGLFTSINTQTLTNNATVDGWLPIWDEETPNERYYVIRITPSTGHLTRVAFGYPKNTTLEEKISGATTSGEFTKLQSCIEIYGRLPYITGINGNFRCHLLKHVHLIDLLSVTNLNSWFANSYLLEKVDGLATWNIENVTSLYSLFENTSIQDFHGIENWDISSVTSLYHLFAGTYVKEIDLSNWIIGTNVTNAQGLFRLCVNLEKVILPKGNFSNTDCQLIFEGCSLLKKIIFSGQTFNPKGVLTFSGLRSLREIDTSIWDLSNVTSLKQGINGVGIETFDLSGKNTSNITSLDTFAGGCPFLRVVNFTGCNFSNVTNTNQYLFQNCNNLVEIKGFIYPQSFIISYCNLMKNTALVEVLTNLPTVESEKTITLGTTNKNKLTAEQIAIATEKGWTVA